MALDLMNVPFSCLTIVCYLLKDHMLRWKKIIKKLFFYAETKGTVASKAVTPQMVVFTNIPRVITVCHRFKQLQEHQKENHHMKNITKNHYRSSRGGYLQDIYHFPTSIQADPTQKISTRKSLEVAFRQISF